MRRLLAVCIAFCLLLGSWALPASATVYSDISNHWAEQYILKMDAKGLIHGDGNGFFHPDTTINNQEAIVMVVGLAGLGSVDPGSSRNLDMPNLARGSAPWAAPYLGIALEQGIISHSELTGLLWDQPAQRQAIAAWMSKALKLDPITADTTGILQGFTDGSAITADRLPYVLPLLRDQIMVGYNGALRPLDGVLRAEAAVIFSKADTKYPSSGLPKSVQAQILSLSGSPVSALMVQSDSQAALQLNLDAQTVIYNNGQKMAANNLTTGQRLDYIADSSGLLLYAELIAAVEEQPAGLTLEQAVTMALKHSTAVKLAVLSTEQSKTAYEVAEQRSNIQVTSPLLTIDIWSVITNAQVQYLNWRIAAEREKITEDSVTMATTQKYLAALSAQEGAKNAAKALEAAEWSRIAAQTNYRVGMISEFALSGTEDSYKRSQNTYEQAQTALTNAYRDLNYLTGATANQPLISTPSYSAFDASNLAARIAGVIANSPSIWISNQSVIQAEMSVSMTEAATSSEYAANQLNIDKADLTAADTRKLAELKLQTLAATIQTDEDSYLTLQHILDTATKNLATKRLMFQLGMDTKGDVLTAEVDYGNAQKTLNDLVIKLEIEKLQFEKPWATS